jgi:hypothetical protein
MSKATIQEVNVEGLFGALNTTGEAKLSDHTESAQEQPQDTENDTQGDDQPAEQPKLRFVNYSEKAFAIVGDTKAHRKELKKLGGRFNPKLKCGAGWIFSKKRGKEVATALGFTA